MPRRDTYPEPTTDEPDLAQIMEWESEGCCETTDGCMVEPDGLCEHGHPSWMLKLGYI
jgi:hypothetical protein